MRDPILRGPKVYLQRGETFRIVAKGGLHMIRGNSSPHFSVTAEIDRKAGNHWRDDRGGCLHEDIFKHWPDLADLVALHLSDINGAPMHAEGNGWYWLSGALGGLGERHHGASGNGAKTGAECLTIFADHCRVPLAEAGKMIEAFMADIEAELGFKRREVVRARWAEACEAMRPHWQAEATAAIAKHSLVPYGDAWPVKVAS